MPAPPAPSEGSDARCRPRSGPPPDDRALLTRLATLLAEGHDRGAGLVLVGLERAGPGAVDVHLHPLVGPDPVDELAGWHAPRTWFGVGLTAAAEVDRPRQPRQPATVAVLAGRDGDISVGVAGDGGTPPWTARAPDVVGRAADLCLRCFGLPTAPCPDPPLAAWAATWLDGLLARLAAGRRDPVQDSPLRWADVAALHPLADLLAPPDRDRPDALRRLADHPLARRSWESVRRAAGQRPVAEWAVSPRTALWLDAGSFGRHVWAPLPPPAELWHAVRDLLPPPLQRDVRSVAAAWGLRLRPPLRA